MGRKRKSSALVAAVEPSEEGPAKGMIAEASVERQQVLEKLKQVADKKQVLQAELPNIEQQIYDLEETYLEETQLYGNVIQGWDAYLYSRAHVCPPSSKRAEVPPPVEKRRLFSLSSSSTSAPKPPQKTTKTTDQKPTATASKTPKATGQKKGTVKEQAVPGSPAGSSSNAATGRIHHTGGNRSGTRGSNNAQGLTMQEKAEKMKAGKF